MIRISEKRIAAWVNELDEASTLAGVEPRVAADDLVGELTPKQARELAARYLAEKVSDRRRAETLVVERSVERARIMSELVRGGTPMGRLPKRGSVAYREWVEHTDEGKAHERRQCEFDAEMNELHQRHMARIVRHIEDFIDERKVAWTSELLDSAIAMPDGTIVLWGDATVAQHQERRDMFMRNALANTEGAARHEQAIRELTEAGVPNLREMVSVRG